MAEREGSRRERLYKQSGKDRTDEKAGEEKAVEKKVEEKVADKAGDDPGLETDNGPDVGGDDVGGRHTKARKDMFKRHETERRDAHGNHREMLRQMAARHEKEIRDLNEAQDGELLTKATPGDAGEPQSPGAGGPTPPTA